MFSLIFDHEEPSARSLKYDIFRTILDKGLVDKNDFGSVIECFPSICEEVSTTLKVPENDVRDALLEVLMYPRIQQEYKNDLEIFHILEDDDDEDYETETEEEETTQHSIVNKVVVEQSNSINTIHFLITCFNATLAVVNTIGLVHILKQCNV